MKLEDLKIGDKVRFAWYGQGEFVEYVGHNPRTKTLLLDYSAGKASAGNEAFTGPEEFNLAFVQELEPYLEEQFQVGDILIWHNEDSAREATNAYRILAIHGEYAFAAHHKNVAGALGAPSVLKLSSGLWKKA